MWNRWPIITIHSPTLVLPYLSWFKGGIHAPATQTNRDTLKATEYFYVGLSLKYRATMMNGRPFIPIQNPTLFLPYLGLV